jgi:hypothetical protein
MAVLHVCVSDVVWLTLQQLVAESVYGWLARACVPCVATVIARVCHTLLITTLHNAQRTRLGSLRR